jgi:hypothetical protein
VFAFDSAVLARHRGWRRGVISKVRLRYARRLMEHYLTNTSRIN